MSQQDSNAAAQLQAVPTVSFKRCVGPCKLKKPTSSFGKYRRYADGLNPLCRSCVATRAKAWRQKNLKKCREYDRNYMRNNRHVERKYRWRKKYGMTVEDYENLLVKQDGCCAICGTNEPNKRCGVFDVDHDHVTGRVRGLLCHQCNIVIGLMKEDPSRLREAADYLEKHRDN